MPARINASKLLVQTHERLGFLQIGVINAEKNECWKIQADIFPHIFANFFKIVRSRYNKVLSLLYTSPSLQANLVRLS